MRATWSACAGLTLMLAAPVATAAWSAARRVVRHALPSTTARPVAGRARARAVGAACLDVCRSAALTLLATPAESGITAALMPTVNRVLPLIVMCWLAGVALLLGRVAAGWSRVKHLQTRGACVAAVALAGGVPPARARLRLPGAPHVVESRLVEVPTVLGWMQPVIVLPVAALANLDAEPGRSDSRARARAHPPARLRDQRPANRGRNAAVLPPVCLVGFGADSRGARALLRRRRDRRVRRRRQLRARARRARDAEDRRDQPGARRHGRLAVQSDQAHPCAWRLPTSRVRQACSSRWR